LSAKRVIASEAGAIKEGYRTRSRSQSAEMLPSEQTSKINKHWANIECDQTFGRAVVNQWKGSWSGKDRQKSFRHLELEKKAPLCLSETDPRESREQ
jgi:hypothetical protein